MIKYGLISETDARTLEKTIDLICKEFNENELFVTEIGLFDCGTVNGLVEYITENKSRIVYYTGVDNEKDKPINPPQELKYIKGNSNEVYNQIPDESQHFIFIDGNHSFPSVVSDYYCYRNKVKIGGFLAFHDVADHIKPMTDYQRMGSEDDPDMYISVKKALQAVGLIDGLGKEWAKTVTGFEMVLYDADVENPAGGIAVFKRIV